MSEFDTYTCKIHRLAQNVVRSHFNGLQERQSNLKQLDYRLKIEASPYQDQQEAHPILISQEFVPE